MFVLKERNKEGVVRTTFSIPDNLKKRMDERPDINWPEVFKQGIIRKLERLEELHARGEI